MTNTVQATQAGVTEWARQGLHYATTKGAPDRALLDEVLEVADLYSAARSQEAAGNVVSAMAAQQVGRAGSQEALAADMQVVVSSIQTLGIQYTEGHYIMAQRGVDEECERELEVEEENLKEVEREVPAATPAQEQDWVDYGRAVFATEVKDIQKVTHVSSQLTSPPL
jgi:hypothetical protein